jgi:hypothetical protein
MTSTSVWKRALESPRPRPRNGPASHAGQPPLRPGTYWEGAEAAPALTRNTLTSTPARPAAPSARSTPTGTLAPAAPGAGRALAPLGAVADMGVAAWMCPIVASGEPADIP